MRNFARGHHAFGQPTALGDAPQQLATTTTSGDDTHAQAFQAPLTLDFAALTLSTADKKGGGWTNCAENEDSGKGGGSDIITGRDDAGDRGQATTTARTTTVERTKTATTETSIATVAAGQEGAASSGGSSGSVARSHGLSVRARAIKRRSVPRRARESMSVDALAAMMERILGEEAGIRRRRRRRRRSDVGGRGLRTGAIGAFGGTKTVWPKEKGDMEEEGKSEGNVEAEKSVVLLDKLEEEEAADELCFLIDKCDLDSEGKQAMFMPYIT